jgi:hypothetical protein
MWQVEYGRMLLSSDNIGGNVVDMKGSKQQLKLKGSAEELFDMIGASPFCPSPACFPSSPWHEHGGDGVCLHTALSSHRRVHQLEHSVARAFAHQTTLQDQTLAYISASNIFNNASLLNKPRTIFQI